MSNITIYLKVDETNHLHLRDSEGHSGEDHLTTYAQKGDNITWTIEDASIAEIMEIKAKPGSEDVFSTDPKPVTGSKDWSGTIGDIINKEESYYISYKLANGGVKTDDPKIVPDPIP